MRSITLSVALALLAQTEASGIQGPGPGPNKLARTPPMGWMSWEVFRCQTNCSAAPTGLPKGLNPPTGCINAELYTQMSDALAKDGYLAAGYKTVSIDDCWEDYDPGRDSAGRLKPNPERFPLGMKALGDHMHSLGVKFGIYSDEGTRTCGGFQGSEGHEALDAKTFASWGVDYLKLDGCYNNKSGFVTGYPAMGAGLQASGRDIVYSCSWPAYLGGNESAKPWAAMIAAGCNSWRNWEDIQCDWGVLAAIIGHWGEFSEELAAWAGPGHWHDPDMLLIGNGCLSHAEEQTQMALWSVWAAPLIMGNDLRNVSAASRAILQNKGAIAVDQDPLGKMGRRINSTTESEIWARELEGGEVAVALFNKNGGAPAGIKAIEQGAYCSNSVGVDNHSSFGYSLASCRDAVLAKKCAPDGYFYYGQGYNGQCTCAKDACVKRGHVAAFDIYQIDASAPATGVDLTVDFAAVGLPAGKSVEVFDIWQGKSLGTHELSYTAANVAMHGTAFLRLTPKS